MDKDYNFTINLAIDLSEQNVSKEATAIIITLFRDCFATEKEKEKLEELIRLNEKKSEIEKREKYNPDDLFKANDYKNNINQNNNEEKALVEYKKLFYKI